MLYLLRVFPCRNLPIVRKSNTTQLAAEIVSLCLEALIFRRMKYVRHLCKEVNLVYGGSSILARVKLRLKLKKKEENITFC